MPCTLHEPTRSLTWPQPSSAAPAQQHKATLASASAPALLPDFTTFEDDIDRHPEDHYLSPVQMYEYEDWTSSDDDNDGEEVEWDAGITDFALFDHDRRRARERQESVPGRWDGLIASQASALQRARERSRADSDPGAASPSTAAAPLLDDIPQLTPDTSPQLRDDLDIDDDAHPASRPLAPNYLTVTLTPPSGEGKCRQVPAYANPDDDDDGSSDSSFSDSDDEEEHLPIAQLLERAKQRRRQALQRARPGLRYSRTLSGKVHVWRWPSREIYPLRENIAAEAEAEMEDRRP